MARLSRTMKNKQMSRRSNADRPWFVYLIEDESSGDYYIGITTEVERRVKEHNEGKAAHRTRGRGPWLLRAYVRFDSRREAAQLEYRLKRLPREKKVSEFRMFRNCRGSMCSLENENA